MKENSSDSLFAKPMDKVPHFVFDESVANVFADMIQRSVPGYSTVVAMTGMLAARYSRSGTRLYDLGCSLGNASLAMADKAKANCEIVAVDNSQAMIDRLQVQLQQKKIGTPIHAYCEDIDDIDVSNASLVALNYTLQFVAQEKRKKLLEKIADGIIDGGVLILSEKIAFDNSQTADLFADLYSEFKRANGYSELEISQKRQALEQVLIPETLSTHIDRLRSVGFDRVELWFQCLNFASLVAFK